MSTGELEPLVVSYSEVSAYMKCPLMWAMEWRDRWRKPVEPGGALDMGTAAHEVMRLHYGSLMSTQVQSGVILSAEHCLHLAAADVETYVKGHDLEQYLRGMYARYVGQWGADEQWEVLGVEHKGEFSLGYVDDFEAPDGTGRREVRMKWIADLIIRDLDSGGVFVWDHKTCSQLRQDKSLEWDLQLPTYTLGAMLEHPEWNITGNGHNEIRKPKGGQYSPNKTATPWGRRTPNPSLTLSALKEIADNLLATVQEMVNAPDQPRNSPSTMTGNCDWCSVSNVHQMMREYPKVPRADLLRSQGFEQDFRRHS